MTDSRTLRVALAVVAACLLVGAPSLAGAAGAGKDDAPAIAGTPATNADLVGAPLFAGGLVYNEAEGVCSVVDGLTGLLAPWPALAIAGAAGCDSTVLDSKPLYPGERRRCRLWCDPIDPCPPCYTQDACGCCKRRVPHCKP